MGSASSAEVVLEIPDSAAFASASREERRMARRMSMDDGMPGKSPPGPSFDQLSSHPLTTSPAHDHSPAASAAAAAAAAAAASTMVG